MAHQRLKPEYFFDEEKIGKLKQIAPEAFEDGKINFQTLKENLGEWTYDEEEGEIEHFGLSWPGKRDARKLAALPPEGTLDPVYGEGLKPDGTPDTDGENDSENIFIEGENLEVLRILKKSYANRIKMIYIDPPYNTGKDFVYDDDFTETIHDYLLRTGQISEEGKALTTNKKSDGRFHAKWLTMMYPRLRLAQNLLKDDGVIFISIDDNEFFHLRSIMNEIFGEENFLGVLKRRASRKSANLSNDMSDVCDYVVCYSKGELNHPLSNKKISDTTRPVFNAGNSFSTRVIKKNTESRCKDGIYKKGHYKVKTLTFELLNDLEIIDGKSSNEVTIKGPWRINQEVLDQTVYFTKNFGLRRHLLEEEYKKPKAINDLIDEPKFYNEKGSEHLTKLFGESNVFQNPKPVELINYLIAITELEEINDEFIILDFFMGSGTTGEALFEYAKANKKAKFIGVQIQEPLSKENKEQKVAYEFCLKNGLKPFLTSLTKERLYRAFEKIKPGNGFKVYSLQKSNFKKWENHNDAILENLQNSLEFASEEPFREGWNKEKLLTEIILIEGFALGGKVEQIEIENNIFYKIDDEAKTNHLLINLDAAIPSTVINKIKLEDSSILICLDNALTNEDKLRLSDKGLIKTI